MTRPDSQDPTLCPTLSSSSTSSLEPSSDSIADWIAPAAPVVHPRALRDQDAAAAAMVAGGASDSAEESSGYEEEDVAVPRTRARIHRPSSTYKRISSATDDESTRDLWLRMVELQQRFGCYTSARMRAAASSDGAVDFMPSRACLDLLNESLTTVDLPPEGWRILGKFVTDEPEDSPRIRKNRWRLWKS